jgi:hypothetical protein
MKNLAGSKSCSEISVWNAPIAGWTRLGWAIYGREFGAESGQVEYSCVTCETNDELSDLIRDFQSTEAFGVSPPQKPLRSKEDEKSIEIFEKTLKYSDNEKRYVIGLLWKEFDVKLPDNKNVAFRRLLCFESKLRKDPVLEKTVIQKFRELLDKGYLQEATAEEIDNFQGRKWYLPVFSVQNINKPGKVRLVYDAAAKCDGIALNDMLMKGPDNLTSLLGVLLRFRGGKIAICGDIADMYHRVKIS